MQSRHYSGSYKINIFHLESSALSACGCVPFIVGSSHDLFHFRNIKFRNLMSRIRRQNATSMDAEGVLLIFKIDFVSDSYAAATAYFTEQN